MAGPWEAYAQQTDAPATAPVVPQGPWSAYAQPDAPSSGRPRVVINTNDVKPQTTGPDRGVVDATARGAAQGLTANFGDEIRGLVEASGVNPNDPASLSALISGALKYWSGDQTAKQRYDEAVARERAANQQAEKQHPVASTVGEVGGALALPVGAMGQAATLPGRMAAGAGVGAAFGGLSGAGAGTDASSRIAQAGVGAAAGGALGAAAPAVIEGVGQAVNRAANPIINQIRGAVSPDAEAGRRVITALQRDTAVDPNAANRLTPAEFATDPSARIADVGGELTRRLADSAAITSPEGGNALKSAINDRFAGQSSRITDWLNSTFNYPNAQAQQSALSQAASKANSPAYLKAYRDGSGGLWDNALDQISQAPVVQDAIRKATITGANDAARQGFTPVRNPFQLNRQTGRMELRQGVSGSTAVPSLQFWDVVKRNLDKVGTRDAQDFARVLRDHLDTLVPSYQQARAGAAQFFGAQDALEAGQNFVASRLSNREAQAAFAKMSPTEQKLFQDGFVSRFVEMLNETGDRRSVLNKIAESPAARERLNMVLGSQKATELEAKLRIEGIMDRLRTAVTGNSWTAQRLFSLGLAGGAGLGAHGAYTTDPKEIAYGALIGALATGGKKIDARVAQRVAEMLLSRDPKILAKGFKVASGNGRIMSAIRSVDNRIAAVLGENAPTSGAQLAGIGRADDQPNVPRPPGQ
jgi:hypothetical protein